MDEQRRRAEARIGKVLRDRYRIDALLGIGGMAVVYLATHRNQKKFAIKMLHPELAMNDEARQRFVREGYVANTIDHPSAVAVMDDDVSEDGAPFIVMELLDGVEVGELADQRGGTLPPTIVLAIADQVLAVLEAAHAKGIIHRDLKPANLFVTRDGTVKVLDFGIARMRDSMSNTLGSLTSTGSILGTPAFLPPEQAGGLTRDIDARTDIWALGATMYKLLTGRYVHDAENATQIVILAATQPAPSIAWAIGRTAPDVVGVVDRALAFDRNARWADAQTMRGAVREAYRALSGGALPTRESLAEVFGIGNWETKFAEVLKPPPGAPSGSLPLPGVVQQQRGTAPIPANQRLPYQPTAPMPQAMMTAQPVEQSISLPMTKSRAPVLIIVALVFALAGVGLAVVAVINARTTAAAPSATPSETVHVAASVPASSFAIAPPPPSSAPSVAASTPPVAVVKPVVKPPTTPSATKSSAPCFHETIDSDGNHHFAPCE